MRDAFTKRKGLLSAAVASEASGMGLTWAALHGYVSWPNAVSAFLLMMVTAVILGVWVDRPEDNG